MLNFIKCLFFIYWNKCIFSLFCYCCSKSCCGPHRMNLSTSVYSSTFLIVSICSPFPEVCDERCRGCSAFAQSRLQEPGNELLPSFSTRESHTQLIAGRSDTYSSFSFAWGQLWGVFYTSSPSFPHRIELWTHSGSWLDDTACLSFFVLPPPLLIMIQESPDNQLDLNPGLSYVLGIAIQDHCWLFQPCIPDISYVHSVWCIIYWWMFYSMDDFWIHIH